MGDFEQDEAELAARRASPSDLRDQTGSDEEIIERAMAELSGLCNGSRKFTMSIPVRPHDSDVVLGEALGLARRLQSELAAMREEREQVRRDYREVRRAVDDFLDPTLLSDDDADRVALSIEHAGDEIKRLHNELTEQTETTKALWAERRDLRSQLTSVQEEAARLRWLSAGNGAYSVPDGYVVWSGELDREFRGATLSEAIDAARSALSPQDPESIPA